MQIKHNKIAFVGFAGSGKDYFAEYLINEHNYNRIAFADSVKKFTHELFPDIKEFYPHEEKDKPLNITIANKLVTKTPREVWIDLTKPILEIDSDFFLKRTSSEIQKHEKLVVTDVRRKEEFLYLKEQGFIIIYIDAGFEPTNSFDRNILDFKNELVYNFRNKFDGIESFKEFITQV